MLPTVKTYGAQLKAIRRALGLSQEQMAERLGYKRQGNLSLYENDKKRPSLQTVLRHARACGQVPSAFLRDVLVTDYDHVRAGEYDDRTEHIRAVKDQQRGEGQPPTAKRRHSK